MKDELRDLKERVKANEKKLKTHDSTIDEISNTIDTNKENEPKKNENPTDIKSIFEEIKELRLNNQEVTLEDVVQDVTKNNDDLEKASDPKLDIIKQARKKIGFYPIRRCDITFNITNENKDKITDDEVFYDEKYLDARIRAAKDYLEDSLGFKPEAIEIIDVKMCQDSDKQVMWITTKSEEDVKKMYINVNKTMTTGALPCSIL